MRFWPRFSLCCLLCLMAFSVRAENVFVHTKTGVHMFTTEIADNDATRQRGLMFRDTLDADAGMLFLFPDAAERRFWMKNVRFPLDIIFIGTDRRILSIARGQAGDESLLPSGGAAVAALEIYGGQADKRGIAPGDRVQSRVLDKMEKTP